MGDTKGFIHCPHCGKPISLSGSVPPETGCAFVPVMIALICVLTALFVLLYFFTYFPR